MRKLLTSIPAIDILPHKNRAGEKSPARPAINLFVTSTPTTEIAPLFLGFLEHAAHLIFIGKTARLSTALLLPGFCRLPSEG